MARRPRKHAPRGRLAAYRPVLDRAIFGLALLGMLAVLHLGIQERRGFDQGCFGFAGAAQEAAFDCAAVTQSAASEFLGVSNIVWGLLFYTLVAALSFVAAFSKGRRLQRVKQARAALIGVGLLYSAYLVYLQVFDLGAFCALCLVSAGIVGVLAVLQAVDLFSSPQRPAASMAHPQAKRETALFTGLAVAALVLAGADVLYFSSQGLSAAQASPAVADTADLPPGCTFSPEQQPVEDYERLISFMDPAKGNPDAPVTVIEYFDPNCPHCKSLYPVMQEVAAAYGDQARFVYKPFALPGWQHSVPQVGALYAAAQEGKFFEMLEAQFARQQRGGLSMDQLRAIAQAIGMNPDVMAARVQRGLYNAQIQQARQQASEIGLRSVPTVLINGHFVSHTARSPACLGALIEAAAG